MEDGENLGGQSLSGTFALVVPVFNDWESLEILIGELDGALKGSSVRMRIVVVDDGSSAKQGQRLKSACAGSTVCSIDIMRLPFNMGHQRAIALGLAEVAADDEYDAVIVMDADGEDKPEDVPRLIAEHRSAPDTIVVAQRTKRSEGIRFKFFYSVYKFIFRILTGSKIDFGNFSLIPKSALKRLVDMPETWNHIAATYIRSPIPLTTMPALRGRRYAGQSRMNLPKLVFHAICAMSVFADVLFARILIATSALAVVSIGLMSSVVAIKLFTDWAIPGWASNVMGLLVIFLVQILILMFGAAFLLVTHNSNIANSPANFRRQVLSQIKMSKLTSPSVDARKE